MKIKWFFSLVLPIHFQSKNTGKAFVLSLNKSEQGASFLFKAVIGYISFNYGMCLQKKLEHRSQLPAAYNA